MEPNPSVFLRAIRRELKAADLFGAGLTSGASRVIVDRGAEILAQLILRREQLPKILQSLRSEQLASLKAISQRLRQLQADMPAEIDRVIERARKLDSEPGEASVELYDEITEALGEGIRALRRVKPSIREDLAFTNDICRSLCESELKLREE